MHRIRSRSRSTNGQESITAELFQSRAEDYIKRAEARIQGRIPETDGSVEELSRLITADRILYRFAKDVELAKVRIEEVHRDFDEIARLCEATDLGFIRWKRQILDEFEPELEPIFHYISNHSWHKIQRLMDEMKRYAQPRDSKIHGKGGRKRKVEDITEKFPPEVLARTLDFTVKARFEDREHLFNSVLTRIAKAAPSSVASTVRIWSNRVKNATIIYPYRSLFEERGRFDNAYDALWLLEHHIHPLLTENGAIEPNLEVDSFMRRLLDEPTLSYERSLTPSPFLAPTTSDEHSGRYSPGRPRLARLRSASNLELPPQSLPPPLYSPTPSTASDSLLAPPSHLPPAYQQSLSHQHRRTTIRLARFHNLETFGRAEFGGVLI